VLSTFSLDGRVAAITGGARGLGLSMARALREAGARVALVDLDGTFSPEPSRRTDIHGFPTEREARRAAEELNTEHGDG
jgi:hypothetical protein